MCTHKPHTRHMQAVGYISLFSTVHDNFICTVYSTPCNNPNTFNVHYKIVYPQMSNCLRLLCTAFKSQISQFGDPSSANMEDNRLHDSSHPAVRWTAPEAVLSNRYSTSSDVWSYGMVLFEIWSLGHKPFEDIPNQKVHIYIPTSYSHLYTIATHNHSTQRYGLTTVLIHITTPCFIHTYIRTCTSIHICTATHRHKHTLIL